MAIQQSVDFNASPDNVYEALLSAQIFGEITGAPADIEQSEGGALSAFGGQITGRQIELVPNQRVVQAWRVGNWDDGVYSVVRFEIAGNGSGSTLTLHHTGYPEDAGEHLEGGWHKMYWEPMKAYFSG